MTLDCGRIGIAAQALGIAQVNSTNITLLMLGIQLYKAANYCRTSDNVRLNLANVRAKVILIGHWSHHKKKLSHYTVYIFFAVTKSDCKFTQFAFCNKIYEAF